MIESVRLDGAGKKLTYGMVGGGANSFIGSVHRKAAAFDGKCIIAAGAFSQDYQNTLETGAALGIEDDRLYKDFYQMAQQEAKRADKIDFVIIAAPNYVHYEASKAFLQAGISVVCEKPLVGTVEQGEELKKLAEDNDLLFCVTYSYAAYPLVRQMKKLVDDGKLGEILVVMGEYPQDWLIELMEKESKQAAWRTDPKVAGISNCTGDIGSHIEHMVGYITGLKIKRLLARLDVVGAGRSLDTNSSVMLEYENGGTGMYWSSQVAIGNDNGLKIRIYGTKGAVEWEQENPNTMKLTYAGQPSQILNRGHGYLDDVAQSRIPSGHPEGYNEAFANLYSEFADALIKKLSGEKLTPADIKFFTIDQGIEGVKFIRACVESSSKDATWTIVN